jgi:hypothetical protein
VRIVGFTMISLIDSQIFTALIRAESILSLLHYRGIVDSNWNREDIKQALNEVQKALSIVYNKKETND